jgi:hypothetical protein
MKEGQKYKLFNDCVINDAMFFPPGLTGPWRKPAGKQKRTGSKSSPLAPLGGVDWNSFKISDIPLFAVLLAP